MERSLMSRRLAERFMKLKLQNMRDKVSHVGSMSGDMIFPPPGQKRSPERSMGGRIP